MRETLRKLEPITLIVLYTWAFWCTFKAAAIGMFMSSRDPAGFEAYVNLVYASPLGWGFLALFSARFSAICAFLSACGAASILVRTSFFGHGRGFAGSYLKGVAIHLGVTLLLLLLLPSEGVLGRELIRKFGKR